MAVAACTALLSSQGAAHAQPAQTDARHEIPADFKGTVGGGLLGAEVGLVLPAVLGLHDWWAYVVFPAAGAGGGAVAGYFLLESGGGHPEIAVATLMAGMALVIPATILTLSLTAYDPDDDQSTTSVEVEMVANPETARLHVVPRKIAPALAAGPGLVKVSPDGLFLGAPGLLASADLSRDEARQFGQRPKAVWQLSLLSGTFN